MQDSKWDDALSLWHPPPPNLKQKWARRGGEGGLFVSALGWGPSPVSAPED